MMLPPTPLHHLLARRLGAAGHDQRQLADEPIARDDVDAQRRWTTSPMRSSPTIAKSTHAPTTPWCASTRRRSSTGAREATCPRRCRSRRRGPTLAVGAQLKSDVVPRRRRAGAPDPAPRRPRRSRAARRVFETLGQARPLFAWSRGGRVRPPPRPVLTRWARAACRACGAAPSRARRSCLAENGRAGPPSACFRRHRLRRRRHDLGRRVLDRRSPGFERAGHLRSSVMPGGERAIREPWRLALAALVDAGETPGPAAAPGGDEPLAPTMLGAATRRHDGRGPLVRRRGRARRGPRDVSYEGQAAIELDGSRATRRADEPYRSRSTSTADRHRYAAH